MDIDMAIETLKKYIACYDRECKCDYKCEECEHDITHEELICAIRTVAS